VVSLATVRVTVMALSAVEKELSSIAFHDFF
jgi:hypothetical protein